MFEQDMQERSEFMPKAKYDYIYRDLKEKIETEYYTYQELLPSEHALITEYDCSRNTVIFQPIEQTSFTVGGIESFKESAIRNHQQAFTKVLQFAEITADEKIEKKTGFKKGTELYYLQRLHSLDGKPLILNHNYFLKELVKGLTPEIASHSIYDYLEGELGMTITTSKRTLTVEHVTQIDEKYIDMKDYNCMAVITSQTFNDDGVQFEFTQSRHRPDYFRFQDVATRRKG